MVGRSSDPKIAGIAAMGLGLLLALVVAPQRGEAREKWVAPEAERAVPNPVEPTAESIARGLTLFEQNCLTCHGSAGQGDGPGSRAVRVPMPDLSDAAWAAERTDGEMFWKIATGRDPVMMEFESYISSQDLWHIVNFVNSLSESGPIEVAAASGEEAEHAADATGGEPTHEEHAPAEAHVEAPAAEHGDGHGGSHEESDGLAPVEPFDRDSIANYELTYAKAPVMILLILSILIGVVFALFPKKEIVPPKEGSGH